MESNVASWGLLSREPHDVVPLTDRSSAAGVIASTGRPGLPMGMERAYGDVSTNASGVLWDCRPLNKLIAFDAASGVLTCEAGVLLRDIQATFSSRGWMLAVTPGTELVTVGGAIANDVHGKNHHRQATFGNHVLGLTLARTDGEIIHCTPDENAEWLYATIGGMGLTGVIVSAAIQLQAVPGPWVAAEDVVFESLDEFFELSRETDRAFSYSVSWVDVTTDGGRRGVLTRGNPAPAPERTLPAERTITFPFTPPFSLVGRFTLPLFNRAYFRLKATMAGKRVVHYRPFFYPLDAINEWNRMYGPKGFYQYQSVIPFREAREATREMLTAISKAGIGSFLGVLKTFGDIPSLGMLSFPEPGVTFAIDFPQRGAETAALFTRLDSIVEDAGGRLYMAKDARMPRRLFEAGYPRLAEFMKYRDPGISSDLSRRLLGN